MRRAFIHIGTPRTGTTTLQRVLFRHRTELAAGGVLYPDLTPASAAAPHLSHQHLGEALSGRRPAAERTELLASLDRQLATSDFDTAIISYEALCLIPAAARAPRLLCDLFARRGVAVQAVLTLKPQIEYLNSTYTWRMQFLREGRAFADFLRAFAQARELDYLRLMRPWLDASNNAGIAVPVRDVADARPLIERVFAAMGLYDRLRDVVDQEDLRLVENRSPGPVAVEVCRRLRRGGAALTLGPRTRDATRALEQEARARGWDTAGFMGHDADLRQAIGRRWAVANDHFAEMLCGGPWNSRVAREPERPMNEIARLPWAESTELQVRAMLDHCCETTGISLRSGPMVRLATAALLPKRIVGLAGRSLRAAWR